MPKRIKLYDENGNEIKRKDIDPRLGLRIRELRRSQEMTVVELAEKIGCSPTQITKIEMGHRRVSNSDLVVKFAQVLGVAPNGLLELSGYSLTDTGSPLSSADASAKQIEIINQLTVLITSLNLTDDQLDQLLAQAKSFAEYCHMQANKKKDV